MLLKIRENGGREGGKREREKGRQTGTGRQTLRQTATETEKESMHAMKNSYASYQVCGMQSVF